MITYFIVWCQDIFILLVLFIWQSTTQRCLVYYHWSSRNPIYQIFTLKNPETINVWHFTDLNDWSIMKMFSVQFTTQILTIRPRLPHENASAHNTPTSGSPHPARRCVPAPTGKHTHTPLWRYCWPVSAVYRCRTRRLGVSWACRVGILEDFHESRVQWTPPTPGWSRLTKKINKKNLWPCCRKRNNSWAVFSDTTDQHCSQLRSRQVTQSYRAWGADEGVICVCVWLTKTGIFKCKHPLTHMCMQSRTNKHTPPYTHTQTGPLSFHCFSAAASVQISPPVT